MKSRTIFIFSLLFIVNIIFGADTSNIATSSVTFYPETNMQIGYNGLENNINIPAKTLTTVQVPSNAEVVFYAPSNDSQDTSYTKINQEAFVNSESNVNQNSTLVVSDCKYSPTNVSCDLWHTCIGGAPSLTQGTTIANIDGVNINCQCPTGSSFDSTKERCVCSQNNQVILNGVCTPCTGNTVPDSNQIKCVDCGTRGVNSGNTACNPITMPSSLSSTSQVASTSQAPASSSIPESQQVPVPSYVVPQVAQTTSSLPNGSYKNSCKKCNVKNDILTCSCKTNKKHSKTTSLNLKNCKKPIINHDGSLKCGR